MIQLGISDRIRQSMCPHALRILHNDVWLAGGAWRAVFAGERIRDYDIFFGSYSAYMRTEQWLRDHKYTISPGADKSTTFHSTCFTRGPVTIELIDNSWWRTPKAVIDDFDLTISQFISDGKYIYTYSQSIVDLALKTLRFINEDNCRSTARITKLKKLGYSFYTRKNA